MGACNDNVDIQQSNPFSIETMPVPNGAGTLKMSDGTVLLPNDLYPLPGETFRLYYTSASTDQQTVDVYFQDSFGALQQLTFSFNNDNNKEEENK